MARTAARAVFRSDIYRRALDGIGADMPDASSKLEGVLEQDTPVASGDGRMLLCRDGFFDGRVFEPLPDNRL